MEFYTGSSVRTLFTIPRHYRTHSIPFSCNCGIVDTGDMSTQMYPGTEVVHNCIA